MIANKRGVGQSYIGVFFLIACIALVIATPVVDLREPIGVKQYGILLTNENLEAANVYLDEAIPYAGARGIDKLFRTSGLYSEETENRFSFYSPCGTHIYPLYNNKGIFCPPDFRSNFKAYVRQDLDRYMKAYEPLQLDIPYFLEVRSVGTQTKLKGIGLEEEPYDLASKTEFITQETIVYPRGIFGGYTQERQVVCGSGECFAQAAQYISDLYRLAGFSFPYVQGGESPYTYQDTIADKEENKESIFKNVDVTRLEVGRNKFTQPGFDASGWLWWVGWHTGVPQLSDRRPTSQDYFQILSGEETICSRLKDNTPSCDRTTLLTQLQPGDLIFVDQEGVDSASHVMIYVGDGQVSHSRGSRGLLIEELPTEYVTTDDSKVLAAIRLRFNRNGQESLEVELPKVSNYQSGSCVLAMDFSQINEESIRANRVSMEQLIAKLEQYDRMKAVEAAAAQFGNVPKEVLLAFMRVEIGADLDGFLSGTTDTRNRDSGAVGVLQVIESTCRDLERNYGACDYDAIKGGDVDEGILAGAAYLSVLIGNKYIDDQRPNYYFLALAYNSGPGSMEKILEATSARTQIPINQLQWRDVTFDDLSEGLRNNGESWGKNPRFYPEKWEYPNLVAKGLSTLCEGSALASYQTKSSSIFFQPEFTTTVDIDFQAMDLVNQFAKQLTENCVDHLDKCVAEQVEWFNENNDALLSINQGGEDANLAYEVVDQWMNCLSNDQANCLCTVDVEEELSSLEEPLAMEFLNTGEVYYGLQGWDLSPTENDEIVQATKKSLAILPYKGNQRQDHPEQERPLYVLFDQNSIRLNKPESAAVGSDTLGLESDDIWLVGEETDQLALGKSAVFLDEVFQTNQYQQAIVEYATRYLGTPYHVTSQDGELRDCRAEDAQAGACKTQCGSFVSSTFLYTLGLPDQYGPGIVPRGNGNEKCDHETMGRRVSLGQLQPGDVFSSTGSTQWGHTGIYVGRGTVSKPVGDLKPNNPNYCYLEFTPAESYDDATPYVFIHSVGPVCYNTYEQLSSKAEDGGQGRVMQFCRHELLDGIDQDEFETVEQTNNAEQVALLQWAKYDEEEDKEKLCRENTRYYRFTTDFAFTERSFGFSLFLDDTTAPPAIETLSSVRRMCGLQQVQAISWSVPKTTEPLYAFHLQLQNKSFYTGFEIVPEPIYILENSYEETEETNPTELTKINQLYRRESQGQHHYTYLVNRYEGELLIPETEYFVSVRSIDHYENEQFQGEQESFTHPKPVTDTIGDVIGGGIVGDLVGQVGQSFLGECEDVSGRDFGFFEFALPDIEGSP